VLINYNIYFINNNRDYHYLFSAEENKLNFFKLTKLRIFEFGQIDKLKNKL